jgi:GDP-D-mannose dehydratase
MWHSLQAPTSDDYTICSGAPLSIQKIVDFVVDKYRLDPKCITVDNTLVRKPNIPVIFGDAQETTKKIGWANSMSIYETINSLIEFNTKNYDYIP